MSIFGPWGCGSSQTLETEPPEPVACDPSDYHVASDALTIERVQASVVDPSGAPAADLPVQVCGLNQCFNGTSSSNGQVSVSPNTSLELPAFKYGDGFDFAEFALQLGSNPRQNLGQLIALPLPSFAQGVAFPKSGTVQSGELSLLLDPGTTLTHDLLTYSDDSQLVFRTAKLPLTQAATPPDAGLNLELIYGVAPLGTTFCPPAKLSVQNRAAWAPGSEVEVFVQGLDVAEKWAPYGSWLKVGEGSVVSDGTRIETTSGGIPVLSSIALRRK